MTGSLIIAVIGYGVAGILAAAVLVSFGVIAYALRKGGYETSSVVGAFYGTLWLGFLAVMIAMFTRWASGV